MLEDYNLKKLDEINAYELLAYELCPRTLIKVASLGCVSPGDFFYHECYYYLPKMFIERAFHMTISTYPNS